MMTNANTDRIETMARLLAKAVTKLDKTDPAAAKALSKAGQDLADRMRRGEV